MKYRKTPEDFIVEEIAEHKILPKGPFKLYTVQKESIETVALIRLLSEKCNIPRANIGIAGIKDTHAQTKQYMTVPKEYNLESIKNIKVTFLGYVKESLQLGDLLANKFIITTKDIKEEELEKIKQNAQEVEFGLPNYYDSQRFGSVIDNRFIAKHLVKKEYELAVKEYLTSIYRNDSEGIIIDKDNMYDDWPKFNLPIKNPQFRKVAFQYKKTKKWIEAYKYIDKQLRLLFISAYQSYLWNECVKELITLHADKEQLYTIPYVLGELVFNHKEVRLPQTFQTISHRIVPEEHEGDIIKKVLEREGLELSQFNIRQTGNFFKSQHRDVMLYPTEFEMYPPKKTDNNYQVTVEFVLPKGCYATMVLKKVFEQ
jgi:tRNA pseudouridine13 synthase